MQSAVRRGIRSMLRVDWSRFDALGASRCTLGVAVPLLAGLALDEPLVGVFGAAGAVGVGFGSFQGAYRGRVSLMLLAASAMSFSVFVGSLAGHSDTGTIGVAALWAFAGGLLVALGKGASFVGLQSIVAVAIASAYPAELQGAAARGALAFAGGLVQTLLVVVIWPLRRFPAERRSLAAVYRSLASYAAKIPARPGMPPEPHTLAGTPAPSADSQPFARSGEVFVFQSLFDEAERIRASLAALTIHYALLDDALRGEARASADWSAQALAQIAIALEEAREPREPPGFSLALDERNAGQSSESPFEPLLTQVRVAWRTAGELTAVRGGPAPARAYLPARWKRPAARDALVTLRANLTKDSTAFRHALRLAAVMSLAVTGARLLERPRGHWLAVTIALVLRPDFHDTFVYSIGRVAGTLLGAAGASAIVLMLAPTPDMTVPLVLAFVWGAYAFGVSNYAVMSACITGYVVFLMTLGGISELAAATDRLFFTALAGVLALSAYTLWPTWAATEVRPALATMLETQGEYIASLLRAHATAERPDLEKLEDLRATARLGRSNAEALVERMLGEPRSRDTTTPGTAAGIIGAARRNALAALSLHAGLERDERAVVAAAEDLASPIAESFLQCAITLREWSVPPPIALLHRTRGALATIPRGTIRDEIDLIEDGVDTIAELLAKEEGRWLRADREA